MQKKEQRKKSRVVEEEIEDIKDIDVYNIQLPFYRVYTVSWVDYNSNQKLLAVSRSNGTVEIWSYPYWHLITKVYLQRELSIRKSFMVEKEGALGYLIIVTANSYVIVYDFIKGDFKQHLLHGGEFAFDADFIAYEEPTIDNVSNQQRKISADMDEERLPSRKSSRALEETHMDEDILGRLILACNDGACRYYDMSMSGLLQIKFTTQAKNEKATACCFSQRDHFNKHSFSVGYDSGDIRTFDYKTKQLVTLISGEKSKDTRSTIWCVRTISPHFIISGYSSGMIKIHESRYGTLVKEFKEHSADILDMCVSKGGQRIYASGADSQILVIGKSTSYIDELELIEFSINSKDRGQSHDIYSIVELHDDLILSSGNSTDMCLYKVVNGGFRERRQGTKSKVKLRHITSVNAGKHMEYSRSSNLLAINNSKYVDIFLVGREERSVDYLAKVSIDEYTIKSVSMSQTSSYVAVCSAGRTEILSFNKKRKTLSMITTDFSDLQCKGLVFGGQNVYMIAEDYPTELKIYDMSNSRITRHEHRELSRLNSIDIMKISNDNKRLVMCDKLKGTVIVLDLTTETLSDFSNYRKARVMDVDICRSTNCTYIIYETNILLKISPAGKVVYFSSSKIPKDVSSLYDRFYRVYSHPNSKNRLIISSLYSFIRIDTRTTYDKISNVSEHDVLIPDSEKSEVVEDSGCMKIVKCSKPMIGMSVHHSGIVVVRFDWKSAMCEIPHPVITKKFGI